MKRLDDHFGGRDEVMQTLQSGDISRIAEVEGISVKRALQLARQVHGTDGNFLATKESERLHSQLIQSLQSFSSCSATSSRMQMLMPIHEVEQRRKRCVEMMDLAKVDLQAYDRLQMIFKQLGHPRKPSQRYERVEFLGMNNQNGPLLYEYCSRAQMKNGMIILSSKRSLGLEMMVPMKYHLVGWFYQQMLRKRLWFLSIPLIGSRITKRSFQV